MVKRNALRFERPKIGDGVGEREGKLLRLRAACGMHRSSIGDEEGPCKTLLDEPCDERGHGWREVMVEDPDGHKVEFSAELELMPKEMPHRTWPHEQRTLNLWGSAWMRS